MKKILQQTPSGRKPATITVIERRQTPPYPQVDEISLVELAAVLIKRRVLILTTTLACMLLGIAYAYTTHPVYEYFTTIEIGRFNRGGQLRFIEPINAVVDKLNEGYIPATLTEYSVIYNDKNPYDIEAETSKNNNFIILKSAGSEELKDIYEQLHRSTLDKLVADHNKALAVEQGQLHEALVREKNKLATLKSSSTLDVKKKVIERKINDASITRDKLHDSVLITVEKQKKENNLMQARLRLAELKDQAKVLAAQLENHNTLKTLLLKQIRNLDQHIKTTAKNQIQSIGHAVSEGNATTVLMLDNQLQKDRDRLATLEERLYIGLPEQQQKLQKVIEDNKRDQYKQQLQISASETNLKKFDLSQKRNQQKHEPVIPELEAQYAKMLEDHQREILTQNEHINALEKQSNNLLPTKAHTFISDVKSSIKTRKSSIVILATFLGLMLGIFLVFLLEFAAKTKTQLAEAKTT